MREGGGDTERERWRKDGKEGERDRDREGGGGQESEGWKGGGER